MPQIKEYTAPDRRLTQPAEGFAAFETAARRIGPAYNAAAADEAALGRLLSASYKERMWPWDFIDARASGGSGRGGGEGGSGGGGGGFRVDGDVNGLYNEGHRSNGQSSRAAGAIGQMFNGTPANGGKNGSIGSKDKNHANEYSTRGGKLIDAETGQLVDPSGSGVSVLRGNGRNTGGLQPLDPNKPNPYGQFGSTPWGYQQPPLGPEVTAGGNPVALDDLRYGSISQVPNPAYDGSKGSTPTTGVWSPTDYGGGRDPSFFDNPVQSFRDWVSPPSQGGENLDTGDYQGTF